MSFPNVAPDTAVEAAAQLYDLVDELLKARELAKKYRNCRDKAEDLYRSRKHRALLEPELDGRNAAERDARAHQWPQPADVRAEAGRVAEAMGLPNYTPETVDDLRWLRDRAEGLAEAASARAYDLRSAMSGWQVVAAMARSEAELGYVGREEAR